MNYILENSNVQTEYDELWEFQSEPAYFVLLNKDSGVICKSADQDKFASIITGKYIKPTKVVVLDKVKDLDDTNSYINNIEILESGIM